MKKRILSCTLAAALTAGMLSAFPASVSAQIDLDDLPVPISADSAVTNAFKASVPQLDTKLSVSYGKLTWKPVKNALFYKVYGFDAEKKEYVEIADTLDAYFNVNSYAYSDYYRYRVRAATYDYNDNLVMSDFSAVYPPVPDEKQLKAFKRAAPKASCRALYEGEVRIDWSEVENAAIYAVCKYDSDAKSFKEMVRTTGTYYDVKYERGAKYAVKAIAFDEDNKDIESKLSNTVRAVQYKERVYSYDDDAVDCGEGVDYDSEIMYEENDYYYNYNSPVIVQAAPEPAAEEALNTEEYPDSKESGFKNVSTDPVSTFSADVDTASYANLRRLIKQGGYIPENAVRIEEMLNYFDYGYVRPKGESPFSVTYEISDCPWNSENKLLMIGVQGKDIAASETPASNLVFLVDTSGSMNYDEKLPLAMESVNMLMQTMTDKDRISIVTYSGEESVLIAGARGNQKNTVKTLTDMLYANGSTNGESGIKAAYAIAEKYYIEGGNNRIIMMTDGDLNVGVSSEKELTELIEEKRKSGVYFSVMGFGSDNIKDNKMEALADNGNGTYSYIDTAAEGSKVL
ncbi:MAG: von Willebrand factor type A domain-containing protein, partial [Ruminococcus sp.]|nr:von Willebrand factor type A domain-containing protein [Ruminococcus sp.]